MPTNPVNIHQDFIPADVLRVQVDTSELPNLFLNPIGEYGVWGWDTAGISNTALQWNAIDSRETLHFSHTSTTFTLRTFNPLATWLTAGSTVYLEGGHPEIGDRYYTVDSISDFAGGRDFTVTAPAGANLSLVDDFWPTEVYDFLNTDSDVSAYLKYNSSFFETLVSQPAYMLTKLMPIQAGQWAGASLNTKSITASHTLRFSFEWRDEDGVLLSTSTTTGALSGEGAHYLDARQAPANTAYMRFKVQMYNGTGTTNPAAGARVWFSETVVTKAATSAELQTTRTNLCTNPSFETNVTGWTAVGGSSIARITSDHYVGTACLQVSNPGGSSSGAYAATASGTSGFPVTAGLTYTAQARMKRVIPVSGDTDWRHGIYLSFYSLVGSHIQTTPAAYTPAPTAGTWLLGSVTATAPPGSVYCTIRVLLDGTTPKFGEAATMYVDAVMLEQTDILKPYLDGSLTDTATKNYSWTGTAHASTSTLVEPTYAYTDPELSFSDVLGRSSGLSINREELDVGTLTVSAKDSSLDPSKAELIRPGRTIRAQVLTGGSWETLYLGSISNAKVNYDLLNRDESKRSIVEITAANGVQVLANSRQPDGVAILEDLGPALYAVNLPALINGLIATDQSMSANPTTYTNESASTLDVVAIARDSESGYAWVSRDNILTAWSADQIPTTVAQTFDEDDYNPDFNVDYDTETCINSVTIKALRITGTGDTQETEEWTFGPYRDIESISEWGAYSAEFTVSVPVGAVLNDAYFQPFANGVLAANATPRLRVNSLTFPVKDEATLARTLIDLYDLVEVTNAEAGITAEQMRVTGISHAITPSGWLVTLSFAHEGSVAAPQVTPPLSSGSVPSAARGTVTTYISSAASVPTGGWVSQAGFSTTLTAASDTAALADLGCSYGSGIITVNTSGFLTIGLRVRAGATAAGLYGARLLVNGTSAKEIVNPSWDSNCTIEVTLTRHFDTNDQITMQIYNNTGASRALAVGSTGTSFCVTRH